MWPDDELITFLQYTQFLSKTYKYDKDLVRWVNKWSANNKMDEETSVEKWRRINNDDTKSTPADIFNKSKNKMREDTIKAQKYLDKEEHGIVEAENTEENTEEEEEEEAENEENEENEEEEKEETEQLEEKNDDDEEEKNDDNEEEKDKNEGIEKVLINVQLTEVNDNTATGRNTNLSVLKKYDFIDFNERIVCNLCLMKLDINCVMHKHSKNFLCSTCIAAAASVHQSTPATIHYPIQNHNGGPIINDFTKHYTTMQDKIEEAMNNTEGGTMKNDEGGNITSITIEKSGYKRKLNEPAADLILAEGTIPFPNQQYSRDDNELSINNAGDRLQSFTTKPRGNLTYCGITYNCNKYVKDKFTDNFMQYFSCTNVYHEKEGIWKKGRNTKDKVDEGKIKCDGSLIVSYTPLSGHIVKRNNKHKCNKEL